MSARARGIWEWLVIGDRVFRDDDRGHTGTITAIINDGVVVVEWDSGASEQVAACVLHKAEEDTL